MAGLGLLGFNGWAVTSLLWPLLDDWLSLENARNLSIALALLGMLVPPFWLSRKMKRKRLWFGRYLALFNLLLAGGLVYYGSRLPAPVAPASPTPSPARTRQPESTSTPLVSPSTEPLALETPTPEVTPEPESMPLILDPAEAGKKYAEIDRYALETPPAKEKNAETLGAYLAAGAHNDEEKMRAIYRWVTDRISYDAKAFFANDLPDSSSPVTLSRRTAVCGGYAVLVRDLGKAAGLKVELVEGYASGLGARADEKENHAWNAVKLNGGWHLLDATWGAGDLGDDHEFHKNFEEFYFLTPAERMLVTHFPTDSKWQLTLPPISREEFTRRPKRHPEFFQLGLKVDQLVGELVADPRATLDFQAPPGLYLAADLLSQDEKELKGATLVDRDGDRIVVNVLPPAPGSYTLRIYAFRPEADYGQGVLDYRVQARSGQPDGYPQIYKHFQQHSGHLFAPAGGSLKPGMQHFELELSGAREVHVGDWDNQLQKSGDRFVGDVLVEPGELNLYAVFSGERGQGIVTYQVR